LDRVQLLFPTASKEAPEVLDRDAERLEDGILTMSRFDASLDRSPELHHAFDLADDDDADVQGGRSLAPAAQNCWTRS
jgi:hypothetical protein